MRGKLLETCIDLLQLLFSELILLLQVAPFFRPQRLEIFGYDLVNIWIYIQAAFKLQKKTFL